MSSDLASGHILRIARALQVRVHSRSLERAYFLMAVDNAGILERKATLRRDMVRLLAAARNAVIDASTVKRFVIA